MLSYIMEKMARKEKVSSPFFKFSYPTLNSIQKSCLMAAFLLVLKKRWARFDKEVARRFWKIFFLIIFGRLVSILNLFNLFSAVNAFFCARKKTIIAS